LAILASWLVGFIGLLAGVFSFNWGVYWEYFYLYGVEMG